MSIENLLPVPDGIQKVNIIDRLATFIDRSKKENPNREYYNSDKTKRFCFTKVNVDPDLVTLEVNLQYKLGIGWGEIMSIGMQQLKGEQTFYNLRTEAIAQETGWVLSFFIFDLETGGLKKEMGLYAVSIDLSGPELCKRAEMLGFSKVSDLPQYIDFEKTAKEFLLQAKRLDFSVPVLYQKELMGDGEFKLNP
jgi:hypothetical protein